MRTRGLRRTYSAPTPLGPYILCADSDTRSARDALTSNGILPTPCTASMWKSAPRSLTTAPISSTGFTVPISLLASMIETRIVLSVMAARTDSAVTHPSAATGRYVTVKPSFSRRLQVSRTALCSVWAVMMWLPRSLWNSATPLMARLSDSVAPDVLLGRPPEAVRAAGRVAEDLGEVRQHRLDDARVHLRRRVIVHVDGELD